MDRVILVVDDSVSIRQMIAYILTQNGFTVIEAVDGFDGLNKLKNEKIDCVITDVNMPRMNGLDFIKKARENEEGKYLPFLVLTTESRTDMIQKGRKAGATGWVIKPFNDEKILSAIRRILD